MNRVASTAERDMLKPCGDNGTGGSNALAGRELGKEFRDDNH